MATYDLQTGSTGLRTEVIDKMVKQTAARSYKFKQAVAIVPTNAWKNTFFREDLTVLSGTGYNTVKGIPRGANFPQAVVEWEEVSVKIVKYGLEDNIAWEDIISNDINVQSRTIIRLTEAVVKGVDDEIWDNLTGTYGTAAGIDVQSFAIGTGYEWNFTSAAIVDDLMRASEEIATNGNYDVSNLLCFVSPRDHRSIKKWVYDKGAQWMNVAEGVLTNGRVGKLAGITFVESNSVTSSYALVVKPKTCATWKELVTLQSATKNDDFKSLRIRVVEEGVIEKTDPLAICLIKNTQGSGA